MSDDNAPDQRSRARLAAIVFGRDAAVTDAERDGAADELARLLEEERERDAARLVPEVAPETVGVLETAETPESGSDRHAGRTPKGRWQRRIVVAAVAIVGVLLAGAALQVLVSGWQPFGSSDSRTVFDRPQTDQDLEGSDYVRDPSLIADSLRYVGEEAGYVGYVYLVDWDTPNNPGNFACLAVIESGQLIRNECTPESAFSSGIDVRHVSEGRWAEISWDIASGFIVTTGTVAPIPPPIAIFEEEQDDADLNALAYLPDIPPSQQDTVRYLTSSAGYFVAAYRDADDAVCLAVYEGDTTLATSEAACVTEEEFEESGIQLIYPAAAPEISVTWGPDPGVAFGGR